MAQDTGGGRQKAPLFYASWLMRPLPLLECCRMVRDAGFDGASFMAGTRDDPRRIDRLSARQAKELRGFLASMGMGRSLHVWTDDYLSLAKEPPAAAQLLIDHVEACVEALCDERLPALNVTLDPPVAWVGGQPMLLGGLAEDLVGFLAGLAERHDVRPGLEHWPFPPVATPEALAGMLEAGGGRVGVLLDAGHANVALRRRWCEQRSMGEFVAALPAPIVEVHLHDNGGERDEHLMPGEGTAELRELLGAAFATGFAGPVTVECNLEGEGRPGLAAGLAQVRSHLSL
ncbi:MAG: sugar phosphate isomerase/epimerase family protein [Planctomycetota bacterium]|jgi:sugar phosphate isomerase/epimerase